MKGAIRSDVRAGSSPQRGEGYTRAVTWRWLIGVPILLAGAGCGMLMSLAHVEARDLFERQGVELTQALTTHGAAFRADLRVASALPLLDPARAARRDGKDAAPTIAVQLSATVVRPALAKQLNGVVIGKFPARALDIDVAALPLGWLGGLAAFDHWELLENRPVGFHTMDLPDTELLVTIARARLLQGLSTRDVKAAGRDVEELARLVGSTEHWLVVQTVPTLLQLTRQTFEHARAEELDVDGWDPPDRNAIDAVRRSLRAYAGALDFHVDPALHGDLLTSADASAGRCAALNDVATTYLEIEPVSGARYRGARAWVQKALEDTRTTCRLTLVREAWGDAQQRALVVGSDAMCDAGNDPVTCIGASIIASFPGLRDLQIEIATVPAAGLFSGYQTPR